MPIGFLSQPIRFATETMLEAGKKRPGTRPGLVQQGGAYQTPDMHGLS